MLTKKQIEIIECIKTENPKILICAGAKRAGKTFILGLAYLAHIAKYRNMGLSFILGGATQASIRRNVLDDMEQILEKELKLDKTNGISVFGNKVYCFDGANADAWKKVRGFTAAGAFLNEGTALHDTFVRRSYPGAPIRVQESILTLTRRTRATASRRIISTRTVRDWTMDSSIYGPFISRCLTMTHLIRNT